MPPGPDGSGSQPPLAILYEHRPWAEPLFARLRERDVAFDTLSIRGLPVDPGDRACPYGLVVNRVSAFPGGTGDPRMVFAAREYLSRLDRLGIRVLNGYRSFVVATSKMRQMGLLAELGLRFPRTKAIQRASQLPQAAEGLTLPLLFKPNIGGSGAGIRLLATEASVRAAAHDYTLDRGADGIGVLQEYHPPWHDRIVRLELLGGDLLYAVRQPVVDGVFNYCVAAGHHAACGLDGLERFRPPPGAVEDAVRILERAGADFGAVEYLTSQRDGERYYFDVNPFSNYVTRQEVLGFDPVDELAAFITCAANGDRQGRDRSR